MKSSVSDYVYSTILLLILVTAAGALAGALDGFWTGLIGDFHVVATAAVFVLSFGLLSALAYRLIFLLRPIVPGTYSMDSPQFTTWKLTTVIGHFGMNAMKIVTPMFLHPLVFSLFGARVGQDVGNGGTLDTFTMLSIGDRVLIGSQAIVMGSFCHDGQMQIGPVRIGEGATIGLNAVVMPNTEIGAGATLLSGSYLMPGNAIPAGETWRGNPARRWMGGGAAKD